MTFPTVFEVKLSPRYLKFMYPVFITYITDKLREVTAAHSIGSTPRTRELSSTSIDITNNK